MLETMIPRLLQIYKTLVEYTGSTDEVGEVNECFELRTALLLVLECERLIRYAEHRETHTLNEMQYNLQNFIITMYKFKSFDCDCEDVMRYINLHSKSRRGLANMLPKLEEDVRNVIEELQRTILAIDDTHSLPFLREKYTIKNDHITKLMKLFTLVKVRYGNFDERLNSLIVHVEKEMRVQQNRCLYLEEAAKYLDGKSDTFMSYMELEDKDFINNIFGGSSPEIQDLLRNSLKEVMSKRGFDFEEIRKMTAMPEKQKKLQTELERYSTDVLEFKKGCTYFQSIFVPMGLQYMQSFFDNMQELKWEMHMILEERSPFLIL